MKRWALKFSGQLHPRALGFVNASLDTLIGSLAVGFHVVICVGVGHTVSGEERGKWKKKETLFFQHFYKQ